MKISAALVSYINTRPYIDGLRRFFGEDVLEIKLLPPSQCAPELLGGRCDLALVPVGALLDFEEIHLMKDHCIGANGPVESVFILSQRPIEEVDEVLLDGHSRSSNGLARILMERHWKGQAKFRAPAGRSFEEIRGNTAGVVIGDKAYKIKGQYEYVYDLSEAWKAYTGLPFVFAVWAYDPSRVDARTLDRIRQALDWGRVNRREAARRWGPEFGYTPAQAEVYLCESIQYAMDAPKHASLQRYFSELMEVEQESESIGRIYSGK